MRTSLRKDYESALEEGLSQLTSRSVEITVVPGKPVEAVLEAVKAVQADLLVLGVHKARFVGYD